MLQLPTSVERINSRLRYASVGGDGYRPSVGSPRRSAKVPTACGVGSPERDSKAASLSSFAPPRSGCTCLDKLSPRRRAIRQSGSASPQRPPWVCNPPALAVAPSVHPVHGRWCLVSGASRDRPGTCGREARRAASRSTSRSAGHHRALAEMRDERSRQMNRTSLWVDKLDVALDQFSDLYLAEPCQQRLFRRRQAGVLRIALVHPKPK